MRFIDKFPATAPFQAQRFADLAAGLVMLALAVIGLAVSREDSDITSGAEIVPRLTAFSLGHNLPGLGSSLGVKVVLLLIRAQAAMTLALIPCATASSISLVARGCSVG